ncbi:MAG: B12-binding domain-containing radical SAM protein [Deltaproteobacteria bacterium]|nr:B12-binding domain-containing radical SAM protein [Deltaproteobacteria bacterium]MCL5276515.1 B12-binding domain-containing radical SAM protein [Deltaproteobacteria bacterium]
MREGIKAGNVLCLYPYVKEVPIYEFFPPIGLEYVATAVSDMVESIRIVDSRYVKDPISHFTPSVDTALVSVNWNYTYDEVCEMIRRIPAHIRIVVGGRQATDCVEDLFQRCPNISIIVRGEGEATARDLFSGRPLEEVKGISYVDNGKVVHNEPRPLPSLNSLKSPDRKLRTTIYRATIRGIDLGVGFDAIMSSRGCPYNCKFCTFKLNPLGQMRKWEARTPESTVREIEAIDADFIAFVDDNFTADMNRVERICDLIISQGIKKMFLCNVRIDIARRPALVEKMKKAGFKILMVGLESAQDRSLVALQKGFKTDRVREAFKVLSKSGMLINGYFIVGIIGEVEDEMLMISKYAREIGIDFISLSRLRWEKFSPLEDVVKATPGYYIGKDNGIYSEKYGRKELTAILKRIDHDFYTPGQVKQIAGKALRLGVLTPRRLLRLLYYVPYILLKTNASKRRLRRVMRTIKKENVPG